MDEQQTTAQEAQGLTPEQIMQVKTMFHNGLRERYQELTNYLKSLPVNQQLLMESIRHFDSGLLWVKEALHVATFKTKPVNVDTAPNV